MNVFYDSADKVVMVVDGEVTRPATDIEAHRYRETLAGRPIFSDAVNSDVDDYQFTWRKRLNIKPIDGGV